MSAGSGEHLATIVDMGSTFSILLVERLDVKAFKEISGLVVAL